jgi:hypothetical protein
MKEEQGKLKEKARGAVHKLRGCPGEHRTGNHDHAATGSLLLLTRFHGR